MEVPHDIRTHPGAPEGQRNSELCRLVGRYLAEHGATADLPELATRWASRCTPSLPEAEVAKSIESLIRRHEPAASKEKAPPTAGTKIMLRNFAEVASQPVEWLWRGRIPRAKVSLLTGDPGLGKTSLTIDIAARVTTGTAFPDGSTCPKGRVLFYSLEDAVADTLKPRAVAAGADVNLLTEVGPVTRRDGSEDILLFDRDISLLQTVLEQLQDVVLLVVDPISATLGDVNDNRNADVRRVMGPLAKLAEETGVAILGVSHSSKGAEGRRAVHRTLGSIAFVAAARTAWCVVADPEDEDRRLMLPQKNNLSDAPGMAFRLRPTTAEGCEVAAVDWEPEPVRLRLDDLDAGDRDASAFEEAEEWLRSKLTEPIPAEDLIKSARKDGISEKTLRRAKKALGVQSQRNGDTGTRGGGEWHWFPPPSVVIGDNNSPRDGVIKVADSGIKMAKSEPLGHLNEGFVF